VGASGYCTTHQQQVATVLPRGGKRQSFPGHFSPAPGTLPNAVAFQNSNRGFHLRCEYPAEGVEMDNGIADSRPTMLKSA